MGLIACQWAKALGAKLIGTVGSAQKAQIALQAGAWKVINYREENIAERVKEITGGKKYGWFTIQSGKMHGKRRWIACNAGG